MSLAVSLIERRTGLYLGEAFPTIRYLKWVSSFFPQAKENPGWNDMYSFAHIYGHSWCSSVINLVMVCNYISTPSHLYRQKLNGRNDYMTTRVLMLLLRLPFNCRMRPNVTITHQSPVPSLSWHLYDVSLSWYTEMLYITVRWQQDTTKNETLRNNWLVLDHDWTHNPSHHDYNRLALIICTQHHLNTLIHICTWFAHVFCCHRYKDPFLPRLFHRISNSMGSLLYSHVDSNQAIATKICTGHDSCVLVACATICCNPMTRISIKARRYFHRFELRALTRRVRITNGLFSDCEIKICLNQLRA